MKQQQAAPKTSSATSTSTGGPATAPTTATPDQNTLGNEAVKAALPEAPAESSPLLEEEGPAAEKVPVHKKHGVTAGQSGDVATPTAKAATADKPADPVSRPSKFTKGMSGALISGGADITLTSEAGKGGKVATVHDGAACKVVEAVGEFVKVTTRVDEKNVTGWAPAGVFSDQPALANDEDNTKLKQKLEYHMVEGDQSPEATGASTKAPTTQGALGDCYLISSMAAIHFANPDFAKRMVKYDAKTKRYTVTFYQEGSKGKMKPVEVVVDGNLPMAEGSKSDPAYAGDPGDAMWGAVVEKAYAKWKGGYDKIEGGDGLQTMAEMTGVKGRGKNPGSMSEKDVIPYFEDAMKNHLAIYAGVKSSIKVAKQNPMTGSGSGPYTGSVTQQHSWNEIAAMSLNITDTGGKVAAAHDVGEPETKSGKIVGADVKSGEVRYKDNTLKLEYKPGKAPKSAAGLEVNFETFGVLDPAKMIIGDHAYGFKGVVGGSKDSNEGKMLQFYNPWGSYQPKPITAAEFLRYFDSLSTNSVPTDKVGPK